MWRREGPCGKCGAVVLWYTNPDRHFVPVNPGTYLLHFISCPALKEKKAAPPNVIEFKRTKQAKINWEPPQPEGIDE